MAPPTDPAFLDYLREKAGSSAQALAKAHAIIATASSSAEPKYVAVRETERSNTRWGWTEAEWTAWQSQERWSAGDWSAGRWDQNAAASAAAAVSASPSKGAGNAPGMKGTNNGPVIGEGVEMTISGTDVGRDSVSADVLHCYGRQ